MGSFKLKSRLQSKVREPNEDQTNVFTQGKGHEEILLGETLNVDNKAA